MRVKRSAVVLFVLALSGAASACSEGGDVTISVGGGRSTSADADLLTAQRVVLTATDLPGYSVEPGLQPDAASAEAAASFQQCAGAGAAALGHDHRTAQSPGFRRGTSTSISSLATLAVDEVQARAAMEDLSRPNMNACVSGLLRAVLEHDRKVPVTSATSQIVETPGVGRGTEAVTWRTALELTAGGPRQLAYSDLTFLRSGRVLASLFDFQLGTPFPAEEHGRLVSAMSDRMGRP